MRKKLIQGPAHEDDDYSSAHAGALPACSTCSFANLCLPRGLEQADLERMDGLVSRSAPLHAGTHLFRVGDAFKAIYAVRVGSFKSYIVDSEGREHVLGFHLPGELLGLEAIYPERHVSNAVALDTASVCVLPYDGLAALTGEIEGLRSQLLRLMSKDIAAAGTLAGDFTAEERIAAFLIGLSRRHQQRGLSSSEFNLTMSRRDIANYLRLAPETVSRVFARFETGKLITTERRAVRLTDFTRLHTIAQCMGRDAGLNPRNTTLLHPARSSATDGYESAHDLSQGAPGGPMV